ncbi:MAG: HEAT repeat domain-containing protein [Sedimentisphaerales bacterium]|nr:HEAT repeat domain-containing protein [Sedimentisphaerales bacterium]
MVWRSTRLCVLLAAFGVGLFAAAGAWADEPNQDVINMVLDALRSDDPDMRTGGIAIARDIPGEAVTKALAEELPKLPPAAQVQLLAALADRGDASALPAVIEMVKSPEESVRIAALKGISRLGGAANVSLLAERTVTTKGPEQKAAREALYRLRGPEVDSVILQAIPGASAEMKVELIGAVGERGIADGIATLLKTATDENRRVRLESLGALRVVAGPEDMPALVNLLVQVQNDADRPAAEKMVAAVAHKIEDKDHRAVAVLAVLPNVKEAAPRASLLRTLGRIGDNSALPILRAALPSREESVQDAAIRALSEWPTPEPLPDLLKVAQTAENKVHRVLALRGFVRLIGLDSDRSPEETIDLYRKAMDLAGDAAEKKRVLSGLAGTKSLAAMNMAAEYLDDVALFLEAESAAVTIGQAIYAEYPQQTTEVLRKVVKDTKNDTIRQQAQEVLDRAKSQ